MKKSLSLVLVLAMVLGCFSFASAASYNDVAGTSYEDAVARLSLLEILTGYKDGTFKPEGQITRAEFAAVAVRAKGLEATAQASKGLPTGFSDVPTTHWASGYIGTAAKMGIVNGVGNGQFAPAAPVKYEEAITMLVRALGYDPSAQVRGGYPYGYLIVANENGLLDDVKGTQGAPALRGEVAQIVDNALEIPMMVQVGYGTDTKWVVSGSKEHGGDERYLLDDMGFDSVKGRVVSVNTKTKKLTVEPKDKDLKNVVIEVADGFDFYSVEGLTTKFWYKNDTVVVYVVKEEAKFDAVKYDKDEKELTLITEDENYEVAKDAYLELNGKKVKADKFEADYAKIVLNDDDEIAWAQGYTLDGFVLVEEVKDNVAYSYDEFDEVKIKDFTVVKEGKTIAIKDIAEEDVLFYNADEDFAVVYNAGTKGKLDRVYSDLGFRFEGKGYEPTKLSVPVYFDEGKVGELTPEILDDLLDEEEEITVYVDFRGNAVAIAGPVSSVGSSAYGVLVEDVHEYNGRRGAMLAFDIRNGANEKASYDILVNDLNDKDIKLKGITVEKLKVLEKGVVLKFALDKDGDITEITRPDSVELEKSFDLDDKNAKGKDNFTYKLQASTIVFYDNNKKAATIGNAEDKFKKVESGTIYYENGKVVAVVGVTNADSDSENITGLVTKVRELPGGKIEFTVKVLGETKRLKTEQKLNENDFIHYVDTIRTFEVGEKTKDIKSFPDTRDDTFTVKGISGRKITAEEEKQETVELSRNGVVYDKDLDEINLRDIKKGDKITVYYQGSSRTFIDYIIVGGTSKDKELTGIITSINDIDGQESFAIDKKAPYFLNTRTVLLDKDDDVIATGAQKVIKGIEIDDKVDVVVNSDGEAVSIKLVKKAADITKEVTNVENKINKLPGVEKLTLENRDAVKAARKAYDALTKQQKDKVEGTVLTKLEAAEAKIVELEKKEEKDKELAKKEIPAAIEAIENAEFTIGKDEELKDLEDIKLSKVKEDVEKIEVTVEKESKTISQREIKVEVEEVRTTSEKAVFSVTLSKAGVSQKVTVTYTVAEAAK